MSRVPQSRADLTLQAVGALALFVPLAVLAGFVVFLVATGLPELNLDFLTSRPSRFPERAGILSACVGSIMLVTGTALIAVPLGTGAALYLEEYAGNSRAARWLELNIATLAGVPSVVYGLLGLEVFVRTAGLGRTLISGSLTLALLVLPLLIVTAREAIRTVPSTLREAALALGAEKHTVIRSVVLPTALPGILTGSILAVSRAIGETAPVIVVGAVAWAAFIPYGPGSPYTVLPLQIFSWISRPQPEFRINAAAAICVLLMIVLALNFTAIVLRDRLHRRSHASP